LRDAVKQCGDLDIVRMIAVLAAAKKSFGVRIYPDAPHGFLRYGASEHKAAIDDALQRTFRFLSRVLTTPT